MATTRLLAITGIRQETADTKTFFLLPINGEKLKYEAGQFITFIFNLKGKGIRRSYSLSSSPDMNAPMSVTIKREENGFISRYMNEKIAVGDTLQYLAPAGMFTITYQQYLQRDIFLVAGGSGITPIISLLKSVLVLEPQSSVTLIYSNHDESRAIFYQELTELQKRFPRQLSIEFLFSNHRYVLKGRLSATSLEMLLGRHLRFQRQQALVYTCGPFGLMQMVQIVALSNGYNKDNIRKEIFTIDEGSSQSLYFDHQDRNIRLSHQGRTYEIPVPYNRTILSAALEQGIDLPYSCRAGRCSACKAKLLKGEVWMHYNEVLSAKDEAAGWVLTCTGHPVTNDVTIDAGAG